MCKLLSLFLHLLFILALPIISKCRCYYFSVYTFCRTPIFAEDLPGEQGEGVDVPPPERSFWAKYVSILLVDCFLDTANFYTEAQSWYERRKFNLWRFIFSVDVLDPSWTHSDECHDPSDEFAWGTSYWPIGCSASCSNPAWAQSCCEKTMMELNCPSNMRAFNIPIPVELTMGS